MRALREIFGYQFRELVEVKIMAYNLYGWSMVQPLPYKDLKFEETCPETFRTILETPDDVDVGYFVEADLEFPPETHERLKQCPP